MNFKSFGLSAPLLQAVSEQGYETPTPVQLKAIPAIIEGRDIMAAAQTGTGKTAGFALPILQRLSKGEKAGSNQARALILTPTRELAVQVNDDVAIYAKYLPLRSTVVYGGVKINPQMMALRKGADVLVATPGRLLDLYHQNALKFNQLEVLVLDEADRMLDMGFIDDIRKIIDLLPKKRQNLMFSATFSAEIRKLAKGMVKNPLEISVSPRNTTATIVKQWICPVDKKKKPALLIHLIKEYQWHQVLVFCKTKVGANKLTRFLETEGLKATAIHGDKSQSARSRALADFKNKEVQILVATDVAARGLDIEQLPQVVNFDLPKVSADYIHRIGRTGRAGVSGQAVSLVSADEFDFLSDIEHLINQLLTRKIIDGFEPRHDVPVSSLGRKPKKIKKPKKPKVDKQAFASGDKTKNQKNKNRKKTTGDSASTGKKKVNSRKTKR